MTRGAEEGKVEFIGKKVRVLRVMEYIYEDTEVAMRDMEQWQVQGAKVILDLVTIKSTVLMPEMWSANE